MVEGPGCKLKGIKIKARLKGQVVKSVGGNAVEKETKRKDSDGTSTFHQLIGRPLEDVQTLGKELFMYFGDICLRVHFLMAGQSFINNQKVDNDLGGNAETDSLKVEMSKDVLTFRKTSTIIRPSVPCKEKYRDLNDLDICSPVFNFTRAVAMVTEQQERQVCDVLLDQSVLPGVGNIIKNEALFDSGIIPSSKISELKPEHITHLIKMTRDFTSIFYMCRRDGKPLHPYYKIYGKRRCKQCENKVTITRLGDDSERVTYYCTVCQTNNLKNNARKLPAKNSLLGWVKTGNQSESEETWNCTMCTLINTANQSNCSVCLTSRHPTSESLTGSGDQTNSVQGFQDNQSCMNNRVQSVMAASNIRKRSLSVDTSNKMPNKFQKKDDGVNSVKRETVNSGIVSHNPRRSNENVKPPNSNRPIRDQVTKPGDAKGSHSEDSSKISMCPTHKKKCRMKEVRKQGDNIGRWFFSCVVRSCNYFEWADLKFPICPGHGKPCTIRTVLKVGPNNGKKFFACKLPKNKQCQFFEWALGYYDE